MNLKSSWIVTDLDDFAFLQAHAAAGRPHSGRSRPVSVEYTGRLSFMICLPITSERG
jgi:hypothetical protein